MSGEIYEMSAPDHVMSRIWPFSLQVRADMYTKRNQPAN